MRQGCAWRRVCALDKDVTAIGTKISTVLDRVYMLDKDVAAIGAKISTIAGSADGTGAAIDMLRDSNNNDEANKKH